MSRCFPYPSPRYVKKGINDEALIESIKLQREDGKAEKEKKREKKREKKEKKARENGELENKKHGHKKRHKDERHQEDEKGRDHGKKRKHEIENLDKSTLTEEHEHPVGSQNSSDSTVDSNKRPKQKSYPDGMHNSASIFRIRLPLQRHKDPEVLLREEQPCQLPIQKHKDPQMLPSQEQPSRLSLQRHKDPQVLPSQEQPSRLSLQRHTGPQMLPSQQQPSRLSLQRHKDPQVLPSQEQPCSASGRTDNAFVQGMHEAAPRQGRDEGQHRCSTFGNSGKEVPVRLGKEKLRATGSASLSITSKYTELIENWDQHPLLQSFPMDVDDQGWLFETKQNRSCMADERIFVSGSLSYGDSASWPCARELPEADIYTLPFTVPF
ncbi:hypothetical protein PRUPE_7G171900 [Prunus persica]|uniref:Uncharacterized protein n=1 Tax=Prunus persica TaxID=3760 RepID=A0A251NCT0_PRUPE|nr:hypothetical protein PRUPE_7G171900 [Prunus persica]